MPALFAKTTIFVMDFL